MQRRTDAANADRQFVRLRARQRDQFLEVLGRQISAPDQQARHPRDHGDRRKIGNRIVRQRRIKRGVDGVAAEAHQQRIAVGRRFRDRSRGQIAARTGAVLDQDRLLQRRCHRIGNRACHRVGGAASRRPDQDLDRTCRKLFGARCLQQHEHGNDGIKRAHNHLPPPFLPPSYFFPSSIIAGVPITSLRPSKSYMRLRNGSDVPLAARDA